MTYNGPTTARRLLLLLFSALLAVIHADIKRFDVFLLPDESTVHFMDGYIRGPGYMDLSDLQFLTTSLDFRQNSGNSNDDAYTQYQDDDDGDGNRKLNGGIDTDGTAVDIAIFHLPESCANTRKGCEFADLGVGKRNEAGELRYCCSNDAIDMGLCDMTDEHYGRLIYDYQKFDGDSKFISIPATGDVSRRIRLAKFEQEASGHYVVLMANCNESGRIVAVNGSVIWKSDHGYLPGELFGIFNFYVVLFWLYLGLALWFGISMIRNRESRIPIEPWILVTILLGFVELLFQISDFMVWNTGGYRHRPLRYASILAGSLKHGISRCLAVMVGLGWGVVRDSLGTTMRTIIVLGTIYTALSVLEDLLVFFAIEDFQTLSDEKENSIIDVASVLDFIISALEIIFFVWMLDAMNNTMEYLDNMNQSRKLQRYLKLRTIVLFSFLACVVAVIFSIVDTYGETGILLEENQWVVDALWETIFLATLVGVAILWRPNPNAKEYAYAMELPALGADGENDLELTGVVPSAMDDDDEDYEQLSANRNGYHDDEGFKGEAT